MILLKDRKIDKKISFLKKRESRINIPTKTIRKTISHKSIIMNDEMTIETKNRLNEEITKNKRLNNKEHIY